MFDLIYKTMTGAGFALVFFAPMLFALKYMFKEGEDDQD